MLKQQLVRRQHSACAFGMCCVLRTSVQRFGLAVGSVALKLSKVQGLAKLLLLQCCYDTSQTIRRRCSWR